MAVFFRPKKSDCKSVIDAWDSGVLRGWVFNPNKPMESQTFYIEFNGKVIASSVADQYRVDLDIAGMGHGRHGFSVSLSHLKLRSNRNTIRLLDAEKKIIKNTKVDVLSPEQPIECTVESLSPYIIKFNISAAVNQIEQDQALRFYCDGNLVQEFPLSLSADEYGLEVNLPPSAIDGNSHVLSLGISERFLPVWSNPNFVAKQLGFSSFLHGSLNLEGTTKKVLFIDAKYPTPNKDAGSVAALNELRVLKSIGYEVLFLSENFDLGTDGHDLLIAMGVGSLKLPYFVPVEKLVDGLLGEENTKFDFVYTNRFSIAEKVLPIIKERIPGLPVVLNLADLHFLREMRAGLGSKNEEKLNQARYTQKRELDVLSKVDLALTYTSEEKAVISSHLYQQDHIHICPWVLDVKGSSKSYGQRYGVAFIGGYNHEPNIEALDYIINVVAPGIYRKNPEISIYIYGSNLPDEYATRVIPNVIFVGYVNDLDELYNNHRVFIAPLISGAGIKGKVLDSISYGLPMVLSDIAAEGIKVVDSMSTLMANTDEEWVNQIINLYADEALWSRISENQIILTKYYSFENAKNRMKKILSYLNKEL